MGISYYYLVDKNLGIKAVPFHPEGENEIG